jgi:hypothetical protein
MPEGFWVPVAQTMESNIIFSRRVTFGLTTSASDCCLGMPSSGAIAVGPPVTQRPPPRSRRAVFPHRALHEYSLPPSDLSPKSHHAFLPTPNHPWSLNGKVLAQCFASCPIVALPLTTAVEPFAQDAPGTGAELLQAGRVALHAIVVVVPTQLGVQLGEEVCPSPPTLVLTPGREPREGVAQCLTRCPTLQMGLALAVPAPPTLTPQNVKAGGAQRLPLTAGDAPGLVCRPCQPTLPEPLPSSLVQTLGVVLRWKRAHKIVRVAHQARLSLAAWSDYLMNPPGERLMPIHLGQDGRDDTPLGVYRSRGAARCRQSPAPPP